jgi:acylphosphatase
MIKLKIQIYGPMVHGVGYRPWLTDAAINAGLDGFYASNRNEDKIQSIFVLAEGNEDNVTYFEKFVRENTPQQAKVDRIDTENFTGSVMSLDKYAAINTSSQLNKAIPLLLSMDGKLDGMNGKLDSVNGKLDSINGKLDNMNEKMECMLVKQDETISEIRDVHEDLVKRSDFRLTRIEKDIKMIKAKLSLR